MSEVKEVSVTVPPGETPTVVCPHCGVEWIDYTLVEGDNNAYCSGWSGCGKRIEITLVVKGVA